MKRLIVHLIVLVSYKGYTNQKCTNKNIQKDGNQMNIVLNMAKDGIPGFSLHFPKELSYGYLWFEGNGKIPLGRQGKRSLKGRAYREK